MILFEESKRGRGEDRDTEGLDPQKEAPFYDLLLVKVFKEKDKAPKEVKEQLKSCN